MQLGFYVVSASSDAYLNSAGAGSLSVGNGREVAKALVADLNASGGILGARVTAVIAELDATNSASFDVQAQAACARFFEDNHVAAVVSGSRLDEPLLECTRARGVPLVYGLALDYLTAKVHQTFPNVAMPGGVDLDRLQKPYIEGLFAQRYFSTWNASTGAPGASPVRIGVLHTDLPGHRSVVQGRMAAALRARGLSIAATYESPAARSSADLSSIARDMQAAVLAFRNAGVTHVLALDPGASMTLFFTQNANGQGYYPRLGVTSLQQPGVTLQGTVPASSLRGALGIGWLPPFDVDGNNDPGGRSSHARCKRILDAAGQDTSSRSASAIASGICDGVFLLDQAWEATGALTARGFFDGLQRLGTSYASTMTFRTDLRHPSHSGAQHYRPVSYSESCSCFRYTGGAKPLQ